MDWADNINNVQMVVGDINNKLESYKLIERVPRTIAVSQTSRITPDGESHYFLEAQKRNLCPLTKLEISATNNIVQSIQQYAWNFELHILGLVGDFFHKQEVYDNQLQVKTTENIINYLRQNDFIDFKTGYSSVYELIEPKGHTLHKLGSIEMFFQKEKEQQKATFNNNGTVINANGNNNVIVAGIVGSKIDIKK